MDRSRFLSILGTSASLSLAGPEEETGPTGNDIYLDFVKVSEPAAVDSLPCALRRVCGMEVVPSNPY
jgi:hypothetical protein